jgi:hypothetical protein
VCAKIIAQLLLENRLAKRIPPRIAVFFCAWAYAQKTRSSRAEIIGPVTKDNAGQDSVDDSNRLHRPQRFVVNRNCSRLLDRRLVSLDQQNVDAIAREKIGGGKAVRPCSYNYDGPC